VTYAFPSYAERDRELRVAVSLAESMKTVNLHAAKTYLSRLVDQAAAGEEVVIAKAGGAVSRQVDDLAGTCRSRPQPTTTVVRDATGGLAA
jgi:hypothetical protein